MCAKTMSTALAVPVALVLTARPRTWSVWTKKASCKPLNASPNKIFPFKSWKASCLSPAKKLSPLPWVAKPFGAALASLQAVMSCRQQPKQHAPKCCSAYAKPRKLKAAAAALQAVVVVETVAAMAVVTAVLANAATTRIKPHAAHVLHKVAVAIPAMAIAAATVAATIRPHGSLKVSQIPCAPALT